MVREQLLKPPFSPTGSVYVDTIVDEGSIPIWNTKNLEVFVLTSAIPQPLLLLASITRLHTHYELLVCYMAAVSGLAQM